MRSGVSLRCSWPKLGTVAISHGIINKEKHRGMGNQCTLAVQPAHALRLDKTTRNDR